jgi:hypothetical protein
MHPVNNATLGFCLSGSLILSALSLFAFSINGFSGFDTERLVSVIMSLNFLCASRGPRSFWYATALSFSIASPKLFMFLGQTSPHFPQLVHSYNPLSSASMILYGRENGVRKGYPLLPV